MPPPSFQKYPQSSCCHTHKHKFTMAAETTTNILVMALPTSHLSVIQAALFSTAIFPSPGGTSPHWSHLSEWNLIDSWVICHLISVSQSPGPTPSLFSQSVSAAVSVRVGFLGGRNYPLKRNKPETYLSVLQKQTWVTPRGSVSQAKTLRWLTTSRFRLPFMPAIILCEQVSTVFKGPRLEVNSLKIHQELPSQAITPVCLANQDKMWNIPGKRLKDVLKSVSKKRNLLNVDALHSNLEGCSWISRTFPESR